MLVLLVYAPALQAPFLVPKFAALEIAASLGLVAFGLQRARVGRPLWGANLFINPRYDDIWMVPQVERMSRAYFEVLRRHPAQVVPFVWSPVLLEQRARNR